MLFELARPRILLAAVTALTLFLTLASVASAAAAVQILPGPYTITPKTYWSALKVTCPAGAEACEGMLSLETAYAIKPYASLPKAKAKVADVAYAVPAGTTRTIKARVYGPALAQAIKTRSVALRITAWNKEPTAVAQRLAVFTLAHR